MRLPVTIIIELIMIHSTTLIRFRARISRLSTVTVPYDTYIVRNRTDYKRAGYRNHVRARRVHTRVRGPTRRTTTNRSVSFRETSIKHYDFVGQTTNTPKV